MKSIRFKTNPSLAIHCCLAMALLGFSGCKRNPIPDEKGPLDSGATPSMDGASKTISGAISTQISAVGKLAEKGAVDEAAADLVKLQGKAQQFTPAEGAAYRQTLGETYTRALAAAKKGDPRGQAALDLIRAAKPH